MNEKIEKIIKLLFKNTRRKLIIIWGSILGISIATITTSTIIVAKNKVHSDSKIFTPEINLKSFKERAIKEIEKIELVIPYDFEDIRNKNLIKKDYNDSLEKIKQLKNNWKSIRARAKTKINKAKSKKDIDALVKNVQNASYDISKLITTKGKITGWKDGAFLVKENVSFGGLKVNNQAFSSWKTLPDKFKLPGGIISIGDYAFSNLTSLPEGFSIPKSVTSIKYRAFSSLTSLPNSFKLPEGLTYIGNWAFDGLRELNIGFTFPDSLTSIGIAAFLNLTSLPEGFTLPKNLNIIKGSAFLNLTSLPKGFSIPKSVISIGNNTFKSLKNNAKTKITIPSKFDKDTEKDKIFGKGNWDKISFNWI